MVTIRLAKAKVEWVAGCWDLEALHNNISVLFGSVLVRFQSVLVDTLFFV